VRAAGLSPRSQRYHRDPVSLPQLKITHQRPSYWLVVAAWAMGDAAGISQSSKFATLRSCARHPSRINRRGSGLSCLVLLGGMNLLLLLLRLSRRLMQPVLGYLQPGEHLLLTGGCQRHALPLGRVGGIFVALIHGAPFVGLPHRATFKFFPELRACPQLSILSIWDSRGFPNQFFCDS
jgi:hypothetical protein